MINTFWHVVKVFVYDFFFNFLNHGRFLIYTGVAGKGLKIGRFYTPAGRITAMSSQCERQFDLVIAVDLSRSLYFDASHYVHLHLKPWLKCLIRRLDIHPYRVRVSIVKYAHGAATLVDLDNGYNAERICGLIDKGLRPSVNFNVNTATALHKVYDILRLQGRPGVQKHVLLIMDDPSDDQMAAEQVSKYLKDKQVHITVIGTDLYEISSLASSKYSVFPILDYGHLPRDYRVVRTVCRPRK